MRWDVLNDNCIFAFLPELEPLFGAYSLLDGEQTHQICTGLYGADQLAQWKRRYRFLFETFAAVKPLSPFSFFDLLLDTLSKDFRVEQFQSLLFSLPPEECVFRQLAWDYYCGASLESIAQALRDDAALEALYAPLENTCASFLGFSAFVRQSKRYFEEFFALAAELDTPVLHKALQVQEAAIEAFRVQVAESLKSHTGLECSQKLMGKSFHNRGPYEQFFFMPSLLLPFSSCRFFYDNNTPNNRQILFCSIRKPENDHSGTIVALKALSDETRYQILSLLAKQGSVKGQDIVRALKLAPSTVSHHMNELREAGLITEEPVKTAKYFGLARGALQRVLDAIQQDFQIE